MVVFATPHAGQTYRLGYDAKTLREVAETFTRVLGQLLTSEPCPPQEFLKMVLAAGAEPAYMRCVHNSFVWLASGKDIGADEVFDNFPTITGRAVEVHRVRGQG